MILVIFYLALLGTMKFYSTFNKFILVVSCYIFYPATVLGQNAVHHEVFTSRDGLAIDYIDDILQDDLGYLWIAGTNLDNREIVAQSPTVLIQRYDGKNFHTIQLEMQKDFRNINKMISNDDGSFLLHSNNDGGQNSITSFNPFTGDLELMHRSSNDGVSNPRRLNGEFYLMELKGTTVHFYKRTVSDNWEEIFSIENNVTSITIDRMTSFISYKDLFIIGDDNFPIVITDDKGVVVKRFPYNGFNRSRDIISDKLWIQESFIVNDQLYAFMNNDDQLYIFNEAILDFEVFESDLFQGKKSFKTFVDTKGNLIVAFIKDEVLRLITLDKNSKWVPIYSQVIKGFPIIQLWSKNAKNELWVSLDGELHYYKFPNDQFKKHLLEAQLRVIKELEQDRFIIGTEESGWYIYDHKKNVVESFKTTENGGEVKLISSRNIFVDNDTIWSNAVSYIVAVNKHNGGFKSYRHYPSLCLEELNDSILLYGTSNYALMQFNKKNKQHIPLIKTDTLAINDISLGPSREWMVGATDKGILTYHFPTRKTQFYNTQLKDNYLLVADYHKDYGFLLGCRSGVITQFDPKEQTFKPIYEDALGTGIATIIPYKDDLWINTFNGLVHYNTKSQKSERYSVKDGLSHKEGNRYSAAITSNGILIGSIKGFNHFIPEQLLVQKSKDSLRLLKIRKFDATQDKFVDQFDQSAFAKAEQIILPVENKFLELDFSLTGLDVLRNESYEYKINDEEWVSLGELKKLQFLNLAAGNYKLNIRVKDFSGVVIGDSLIINILSDDFFYKKWWFFVLVGLLTTFVLLWFLYQERLKSLMQVKFSQNLIQNQEKERSRIAKELHDSIGQQLTLIKQKAQAQELDSIAQLTNATLEEVRSISRNLFPVIIKQLGLKGAIDHLMLQVDEETDLFVSVMVDDIDALFTVEQSVNIYRFIQECVSNVLKHSQATTVEVNIEKKKKMIIIDVIDNGIGFNVEQKEENLSLGLKTLNERIKILNGTLSIQSRSRKGSFVTAKVPLNS